MQLRFSFVLPLVLYRLLFLLFLVDSSVAHAFPQPFTASRALNTLPLNFTCVISVVTPAGPFA